LSQDSPEVLAQPAQPAAALRHDRHRTGGSRP
jgi:hypothetical protein